MGIDGIYVFYICQHMLSSRRARQRVSADGKYIYIYIYMRVINILKIQIFNFNNYIAAVLTKATFLSHPKWGGGSIQWYVVSYSCFFIYAQKCFLDDKKWFLDDKKIKA